MALTDAEFEAANRAAAKSGPRPLSARYDRRSKKIVVALDTGIDIAFRGPTTPRASPAHRRRTSPPSPSARSACTGRGSMPTSPSPAFSPDGSVPSAGWRR